MAHDYTVDATRAARQIAARGAAFTIYRSKTAYDGATGTTVTTTTNTGSFTAVLLPRSTSETSYDTSVRTGLKVVESQRMIIAAYNAPFVLQAEDKVTIGTETWRIEAITEIKPDGVTPIIYMVSITRG